MHEEKCFYTIKEFALRLCVHPNTVRRAIKNGHINALKMGGKIRKVYRIPYSEFERMAMINLEEVMKNYNSKKN